MDPTPARKSGVLAPAIASSIFVCFSSLFPDSPGPTTVASLFVKHTKAFSDERPLLSGQNSLSAVTCLLCFP